jgi:transposase
MSCTSVLTDEQWELIRPLPPSSEARRGRPFRDDRPVVEGIFYRYRCGIA